MTNKLLYAIIYTNNKLVLKKGVKVLEEFFKKIGLDGPGQVMGTIFLIIAIVVLIALLATNNWSIKKVWRNL